jgi:hypothetical protein
LASEKSVYKNENEVPVKSHLHKRAESIQIPPLQVSYLCWWWEVSLRSHYIASMEENEAFTHSIKMKLLKIQSKSTYMIWKILRIRKKESLSFWRDKTSIVKRTQSSSIQFNKNVPSYVCFKTIINLTHQIHLNTKHGQVLGRLVLLTLKSWASKMPGS